MKPPSSKDKRLKNGEIQFLLKRPKKVGGRNLIVYARENQLPFCRSAISISRKTIRHSSGRNLFRRRIKASLVQAQKEGVGSGGYDRLIVVKTKEILSYEETKKELFCLLKKLKLR